MEVELSLERAAHDSDEGIVVRSGELSGGVHDVVNAAREQRVTQV